MGEGQPASAERLARLVLRHRAAVVAATLLLAGAAVPGALRLERDDSVRAWFEPGAAVLQRYDALESLFGSDELIVLAVPTGDVFHPDALELLDALTRAIERLPEVDRAWSLTNVEAIVAEPDGSVFVGELIRRIPPEAGEVARARESLATDPLLRTRLVSADGDEVSVVARLRPGLDEASRHRATAEIRGLAYAHSGAVPPMAGQPVLDEAFFRLSNEDLARLLPLMLAVMGGALVWIFRSVAAVLLPLAGVAITVTFTLCALATAQFTSNILVSLLPLILLIVGVFSSVHLMLETQRSARRGAGRREAVERALGRVAVPTLAANLTTAAGFAAFVAGPAPPVRTFGAFAAFGILVSCGLSLTFLPACLSFVRLEGARRTPLAGRRAWLRLAGISRARPRATVGVAAGLAAAAGVAALAIDRSENWLEYFPREHPVPRDVAVLESAFFGIAGLEVVLRGEPSVLLDPAVLRRVDALSARLAAEPAVERTVGLPDFLSRMHGAVHGDGDGALPGDAHAVAQYLLLLRRPRGEVEQFLAADDGATRVSARVRLGDAASFGRLVALAEREARAVDPRLETFVTGITDLNFRNGENIVALQVASLAVAFPVVALIAGLVLRSARMVPVVAVTSALPVVGCLGLMGALGIPLTPGSALVGSIALGFVVDDAVFLLARWREGAGAADALARALCEVGPGLAHTSLVVCAGFAVLGLSRFAPNTHFGVLTCLGLGLAFLVNVLVLPSLVQVAAGRRRRRS